MLSTCTPLLALCLLSLCSCDPGAPCRRDRDGLICRAPSWPPDLLSSSEGGLQAVRWLRVVLTSGHSHLTAQHLKAVPNLRQLAVTGAKAAGLRTVAEDTFRATPLLSAVTLRDHPLTDLRALSSLSFLKSLNLYFLPQLKEKPRSDLLQASRASLETVNFIFLNVDELPTGIFSDFPKLRLLALTFKVHALTIRSNAISDLPALEALQMSGIYRSGAFTDLEMDAAALSDLPRLATLRFKNFHFNANRSSAVPCRRLGPIQSLILTEVNAPLLSACPEMFFCARCGMDPARFPQTIVLDQYFTERGYSVPALFSFNVSVIDFCAVLPNMTLMPLLTKVTWCRNFPLELEDRTYPVLPRLATNAFVGLPHPSRLQEVRVSLSCCDCGVLDFAEWMSEARGHVGDLRKLDGLLKIDCIQVADFKNAGNVTTLQARRQRTHVRWMSFGWIAEIMRPQCRLAGDQQVQVQPKCAADVCRSTACLTLIVVWALLARWP